MSPFHRRKFTDEKKRSIVQDACSRGINVVLREHNLSYSVFSRWRERFQPYETKEEKTKNKLMNQVKELVTENERLKKIIAKQALEIQIKTEKLENT